MLPSCNDKWVKPRNRFVRGFARHFHLEIDFTWMDWVSMLAYITGTVDQELLLRNEYLVAENRILKAQLKTPLRLTDAERATLAA